MSGEVSIDIVVLSKSYKVGYANKWVKHKTGTAAIWQSSLHPPSMRFISAGEGYVRVKYRELYLYSKYFLLNTNQVDFEKRIEALCTDAHGKNPVISAGDFNALIIDWGSKWTNAKTRVTLESLVSLDMTILNVGIKNTFNRGRHGPTIDIAIASRTLALRMTWSIRNIYTHSDQLRKICELQQNESANKFKRPLRGPK